jgi:hypothetical protein
MAWDPGGTGNPAASAALLLHQQLPSLHCWQSLLVSHMMIIIILPIQRCFVDEVAQCGLAGQSQVCNAHGGGTLDTQRLGTVAGLPRGNAHKNSERRRGTPGGRDGDPKLVTGCLSFKKTAPYMLHAVMT